jgi:hypothetical protein
MTDSTGLRSVLLIDGPCAGQLVQVPEKCHSWVVDAPPIELVNALGTDEKRMEELAPHIVYRFERVRGFGHVIEVGWSDPTALPSALDVADYVLTDAAKKARRG